MAIRISGISSGLDTESLVSELVSAYSIKKDSYKKAQTKLSWKQDAWKALNKKVYSLYSNISSLRYSSAYSLKKTTVSDTTKATVTASSSAVNGTQKLKINQLAQAGYLTGGTLKTREEGGKVSSSTKLSELAGKVGDTKYGITEGGGTINVNGKEITLNASDSVANVVTKLKDAGVNASYDSTNNRIFVSSKDSGTANEFTLTASDENGAKALQSLGLMAAGKSDSKANQALVDAYTTDGAVDLDKIKKAVVEGGLDSSSFKNAAYIQNIKAYQYASSGDPAALEEYDSYLAAKSRVSSLSSDFNLSAYKSLSGLSEEDRGRYFNTSTGTSISAEDWAALSDEEKTGYKVGTEWLNELQTLLNDSDYEGRLEDYEADKESVSTYEAAHDANDLAALAMVKENPTTDFAAAAADAFKEKVIAAQNAVSGNSDLYGTSDGAVRVNAEDASITLNGAVFTGSSNTFNINGLTINATGVTDQEISITTNSDSQAIYDKVKDFLNQYNDLVNEMNNLYRAPSAKGYEPLTTEEKAALTDTQVEEWEDKVKSALLRKDSTLDSLLSSMTGSMQKSYIMGTNPNGTHITLTAQKDGVTYKGNDGNTYTLQDRGNGKYTFLASDGQTQMTAQGYSWASFGINTLGILNAEENQEFAYHIDGDADDSVTSGKADKLMRAINNDPDAVIDFLKNASSSLYDSINKKMSSTTLRSAYTVYNDKQMGKEYSDYNTTIKKWEDKVAKIEDSYYKKFAAMEKALSTMNSNQTALGGMF